MILIVRFKDKETGLECDLSSNNRLGVMHAKLMNEYNKLYPQYMGTLKAIKSWANDNRLNNPRHKQFPSFSSHSLGLMTISFLQVVIMLPMLSLF